MITLHSIEMVEIYISGNRGLYGDTIILWIGQIDPALWASFSWFIALSISTGRGRIEKTPLVRALPKAFVHRAVHVSRKGAENGRTHPAIKWLTGRYIDGWIDEPRCLIP